VTWNSERHLPSCLDGLEGQGYSRLELIVIDNGSSDRSVALVRERWPTASVIENGRNEGFCRAHNAAIRASAGEYYLALNPDVQLLPGFIEHLVSALENRPEFGSAVGKMWQQGQADPPLLDAAGLFLDRRRHQYLRGRGEPDRGQYDMAEEVFGADGAAPLYRRAMLEDVKIEGQYFDEQFFAYMEDVDLAWRARLLGWRCWYEPAATAFHARSFQPGRRRAMPRPMRRIAVKNRYLMLLKNEGSEEWRRDWWRILAYDLAIWGYILLLEQSSVGALPLLRRGWRGAQAWRSEIWRRGTAGPQERLRWFA
jgi:GT2 family glycosyltransferase